MSIAQIWDMFSKSCSTEEIPEEVPPAPKMEILSDELLSAEPLSRTSDPLIIQSIQRGGYMIKLKRGVKRITLFRFLLAKMVYEEKGGLHLDEYLALYELSLSLVELKDPTFQKKYAFWLAKTSAILQGLRDLRTFPVRVAKHTEEYPSLLSYLEPFLPTSTAYFGLKGNRQLRNSWTLLLKENLQPTKKRERRIIGVGYRDKGYLKESHDGNPDWREVASHASELLRRFAEGEISEEMLPHWLLSEIDRESGG